MEKFIITNSHVLTIYDYVDCNTQVSVKAHGPLFLVLFVRNPLFENVE